MLIVNDLRQPLINYVDFSQNLSSGENILGFEIKPLNLNSGNYNFSISIIDNKSKEILLKQEGICPFFVKSETYYWSNIINMISLKKFQN